MGESVDLRGVVVAAESVVRHDWLPALEYLLAAVDPAHPDHDKLSGLGDIVDTRSARQHIRDLSRGFREVSRSSAARGGSR